MKCCVYCWAYLIHIDEYANNKAHRDDIYLKSNKVKYFDSFGIEHAWKEIKRFIDIRIVSDILKIQNWIQKCVDNFHIGSINFIDLLICEKCIDFMLNKESLKDFTRLKII